MATETTTWTPPRCPGSTCDFGRTQDWIAGTGKIDGEYSDLPPGHFWYKEGEYLAHEAAGSAAVTPEQARDPLALLGEIRQRETVATKGPWRLEMDSCDCGDGYGCSHGSWPYAIHLGAPHVDRDGEPEREDDRRYTELHEMRLEDAEFACAARSDIPRLLAIPDALLADHHVEPLYEAAENCGHPEPDRAADIDAWEAWNGDHPWGTGPDGEDDTGDRICRLTQNGEHCAGCSEWLAREYGGDDFVHPGNCLVRPVIAAALSSEETPS